MTIETIKHHIIESDSYQRETMQFIDATTLEIDRELSDLDRFALQFTTLLEKHTPYVIVSGYVSILLGRARASEEIHIIIPKISKEDHHRSSPTRDLAHLQSRAADRIQRTGAPITKRQGRRSAYQENRRRFLRQKITPIVQGVAP